ncbi:zinc finger protein ztf-16 isoform X2 [Chrysoperla carnea]|nr:zinc finger protein ztf-16 isoform X2 [Chrysoperla carnea]
MADVAGEADSGGARIADSVPTSDSVISVPIVTTRSRHLTRAVSAAAIARVEEPQDNDDKVTASSNYDSADGGVTQIHRCDQCDIYESASHSALLAHVAQCHSREAETVPETVVVTPTVIPTVVKNEITTAVIPPVIKNENNNQPADRPHRKLFECDVCNMKFSNGANMRRHRMRHTGVKPYECRVCQKRFFRKDHLAEHFTTHTKTLPYHCPICNRGFQRQIAMRAHFQNEHVGQHDLVKSCPLCSYRAGSMKSLRVHFFNRHGIDLDNPGPAGSQASLLAAAAAAGRLPQMDPATMNALSNLSVSVQNYSDSGESTGARSADNATPPMHFLTPHVEISMADAPASFSPSQQGGEASQQRVNGECPNSPQSADSNSNAPSSSLMHSNQNHGGLSETSITPSISLIPIKQEPQSEDNMPTFDTSKLRGITLNGPVNLSTSTASGSVQLQTATSSSLSSLIKVSPLKSLLREDLKRKMATRNTSTRNRTNNMSPNPGTAESGGGSNNDHPSSNTATTTTTNGIITSTGPEHPSDSSTVWRFLSKRGLNGLNCTYCGIGFPDQTLYFLHKGCHSDANPWKCNICGEQCSNVYEFNSHLLSKSHQ